jgi:lipid A 3-O-deacylase
MIKRAGKFTRTWCFLITGLFAGKEAVAQSPYHAASEYLREQFTFQYDNDFFNATDRYYTQGIVLGLQHQVLSRLPLFRLLPRLKESTQHFFIGLQQDVYTPKSIRYRNGAVYEGERPFTATLYLSHRRISVSEQNKVMLVTELELGVLGPPALGEQEQKAIHRALNNITPQGWENQLSTDLVLNYNVAVEKALRTGSWFDCGGLGRLRAGTVNTDLELGLTFHLGKKDPWTGPVEKTGHFRLYFTGGVGLRAVAYNATLQGGLTNKGNIYELPGSAVSRWVGGGNAGLTLVLGKLKFSYMRYYITPEFTNAADHGWGSCVITVYL